MQSETFQEKQFESFDAIACPMLQIEPKYESELGTCGAEKARTKNKRDISVIITKSKECRGSGYKDERDLANLDTNRSKPRQFRDLQTVLAVHGVLLKVATIDEAESLF